MIRRKGGRVVWLEELGWGWQAWSGWFDAGLVVKNGCVYFRDLRSS